MILVIASAIANLHMWLPLGVHSLLLVIFQDGADYMSGGENLYNILIALVFGFSGLNVLGLATGRFERRRRGLNFNEIFAITTVVLSLFFLGSEMLHVFHVFPIKLQR